MMGGRWRRARNVIGGCQHVGVRPALKAGLLPVWRDRGTLQIGVDPRRAVALTGLGPAAAVISLLDGSRDRAALIAAAQTYGIGPEATGQVLATLAAAGVLDDFPARLHASMPDELRARLAPELATAALAYGDSDGGARTLARRRGALVRGPGAGRARGERSQAGAARAVQRAAPDVRTGDDGAVPDLVVLTGPVLPDLIDALLRDRVPHLALRTGEAIGVVGPLVLPGRSACLRCVDLRKASGAPARAERRAQPPFGRARPEACDTVLAAMTATLASAQALAYIDRPGTTPAGANGTLEVVLPDWQWRRRTWPPHAACRCGGAARTVSVLEGVRRS